VLGGGNDPPQRVAVLDLPRDERVAKRLAKPNRGTSEYMAPAPTLRELQAVAKHASDRLALYRRRMYVGRGDLPRLAELTRIAEGAARRLATAKKAARAASRRPPSP
jgi:hypothetical protein